MDRGSSCRSMFKEGLASTVGNAVGRWSSAVGPYRANLNGKKLCPLRSHPSQFVAAVLWLREGYQGPAFICGDIPTPEIPSGAAEAIRGTLLLNFSSAYPASFPSPPQLFIPWCPYRHLNPPICLTGCFLEQSTYGDWIVKVPPTCKGRAWIYISLCDPSAYIPLCAGHSVYNAPLQKWLTYQSHNYFVHNACFVSRNVVLPQLCPKKDFLKLKKRKTTHLFIPY